MRTVEELEQRYRFALTHPTGPLWTHGALQWAEDALEQMQAQQAVLREIRSIIERVVQDAESQHPGGWGPDVTTVAQLKDALEAMKAWVDEPRRHQTAGDEPD